MYDDDRDALAAEYVLGTLSADEREQAEALLAIDPGFAEIVRVWERRLGELNVMVEAVDPPPDVWNKIQTEIESARSRGTTEVEAAPPMFEEAAPEPAPGIAADTAPGFELTPEPAPEFELTPEPTPDLLSETPRDLDAVVPPEDLDAIALPQDLDDAAAVAALASSLQPSEPPPAVKTPSPPEPPTAAPSSDRSAAVIELRRGVRRWRGLTVAMSAIAAMLAAFIAVTQFAPGLIPVSRQPQPVVAARPQPAGTRLVAVLQQEPTAPAFLLTVDPQSRSFTVRTVSATPESGRSYELWLIANKNSSSHSLGLVGSEEFTTRPLPANFDVDTVRTADYAVSLEPAGGSPSGAPTGPILFTGKMVESVPGSPS